MKARVIETGEIVEVYFYGKEGYDYVCNDKEEIYERGELEILDDPDYWTRLEHTYAGMAMQGLLNNNLLSSVLFKTGTTHVDYINEVVKVAKEYAHALVEKYKKEE